MRELDKLEKQIEKAKKALEETKKENAALKDEVDSLWSMMDEIMRSDVENYSHLVEDLKSDIIAKSLMVTKKVDC